MGLDTYVLIIRFIKKINPKKFGHKETNNNNMVKYQNKYQKVHKKSHQTTCSLSGCQRYLNAKNQYYLG